MKNKRIWMGMLSGLTAFGMVLPVNAETFYGDESWNVTFSPANEMVSSFSTTDINDVVGGMQPGDNVIITLKLKNEVLYSLEDRSANREIGGGAYTYRLFYTDKNGTVETLFDSDTVGGENGETVDDMLSGMGEGLHGATNALKDYFYLDTVQNGEGGMITLEVALDGETQGNSYQDTLADLQMNFAVELRDDLPVRPNPENPGNPPQPVDDTRPTPTPESGRGTGIVRTSDESRLPVFAVAGGVSGLLLLIYCIYCFREHKKGKKEA